MSADEPDPAAGRKEAAASRTRELQDLRGRLQAGEPVTQQDLELADERLAQAVDYARKAHDRAAAAHRRAAAAHLSAADVAERVGDAEMGEQHRRAAEADEQAALDDDVRAANHG